MAATRRRSRRPLRADRGHEHGGAGRRAIGGDGGRGWERRETFDVRRGRPEAHAGAGARGRAPDPGRRRGRGRRRAGPALPGVLLRDVLAAAGPVEDGRHDLRQSIVVVTATDGYKAVFSWAELFLSPIGDGAMVIFERDGTPLPATDTGSRFASRHAAWTTSRQMACENRTRGSANSNESGGLVVASGAGVVSRRASATFGGHCIRLARAACRR